MPKSFHLEQYRSAAREGCGGAGLRRLTGSAELEGRRGLHDLPALHLWRRQALLLDGGVQPQAEAAASRSAPEEALQSLGSCLAEGSGCNPTIKIIL